MRHLPKRAVILVSGLGVLWFLAALSTSVIPAAPRATGISNLRVTNVRAVSFTVSWMTEVPAAGQVNWGPTGALGNVAVDVRDPGYTGRTHYVVVTGPLPETTYFFDVVSDSVVDDNGGQHYSVTTAAVDGRPRTPDLAYGQAFGDDGEPAIGTALFLALRDADGAGNPGQSAWMSSLIDEYGYWHLSLSDSRLADLSGLFDYTPTGGDTLCLVAEDPDGNRVHRVFDIAHRYPTDDLQLIPGPLPCDADLICDGIVDGSDLAAVTDAWRQPVDKLAVLSPDLNGDGVVNVVDVQRATASFGQTCQ